MRVSTCVISISLLCYSRASIPVITAIVAVVVEHQIPGKGEAAGLLVLTGGVMLSVCCLLHPLSCILPPYGDAAAACRGRPGTFEGAAQIAQLSSSGPRNARIMQRQISM